MLDDFGTGYSSLSYLRRLPLDTIKIDRSFVSGPRLGRRRDLPIVQAVISLAHGLGIDVVAEGIETAAQLACLRDLGCDRGQGYRVRAAAAAGRPRGDARRRRGELAADPARSRPAA